MLIVLEGPDASGKSTLLEYFRKRKYTTVTRRRPDSFAELYRHTAFLQAAPYPTVCDRAPPVSDAIYGYVFNRPVRYTFDQAAAWCDQYVGLFVYCRPPLETIRARLYEQPQLAGVIEKIDELTQIYDRFTARLGRVHLYDYTKDAPKEIERVIG